MLHQLYAAGLIDLRDPIHFDFAGCDPPPPLPGNSTTHSFSSAVRARLSTDGGQSPTRASTGRTTERPGAEGYYIDSFFDIFTELSLDGGPWGLIKSLYRR